jgi:hypothetical protein
MYVTYVAPTCFGAQNTIFRLHVMSSLKSTVVLPEDGVLSAETSRSDICNIQEHCVHLVGTVN